MRTPAHTRCCSNKNSHGTRVEVKTTTGYYGGADQQPNQENTMNFVSRCCVEASCPGP